MAKKKLNAGLRWVRETSGISQDMLALKAGISKRTIQNIERRGAKPSLRTLEALARALGVPVGYLL